MQTSEFIQQRPTHRKELSDEFFAADFIDTEQIKVEVDPDDQHKTRRKRTNSILPPIASVTTHPKKRALIISGVLSFLFLFVILLYLIFINQVVNRRIVPRFSLWLDRDRNHPQNSCVFFTTEKVKTVFHERFFKDLVVTENMINSLAGKDVIRMAIVKNKVFIREDEKALDHALLLDFLSDMTSNFVVPDVMFALYVGKTPPIKQTVLFSVVEPIDHVMITVPNITDVYLWETKEKNKFNRLKNKNPFEERKKVVLYRGAYSNPSKPLMETTIGSLLRFSSKYPELVDAKLTSCDTCSSEELSQLQAKGQLIDKKQQSIETDLMFRNQIILSPQVSLKKLFSNTLLMSVESVVERFSTHLTPFVQYVPIKEDLSDLPQRIRWVNEYHGRVLEIAARAEHLAETLLSMDCSIYHWKLLLDKYAKHQKIDVRDEVSKQGWVRLSPYRIYS
jgi:hypothetical protein